MFSASQQRATLCRLDNAVVLDFLTSIAGTLASHGLISTKDTDSLRLVLSGIQSSDLGREEPILLELVKQNAEFLKIVEIYFGTSGFSLNILRHTLRPHLPEMVKSLSLWGQEVLQKSQTLFNRPFYIFLGDQCERRILNSSLLIELSEALAEACTQIGEAQKDLAPMLPFHFTDTESYDGLMTELAKTLGFASVKSDALPIFSENKAKRKLADAFSALSDTLLEMGTQMRRNLQKDLTPKLASLCEVLHAECTRLRDFSLAGGDSLEAWEIRRQAVLDVIVNISECLTGLQGEFHKVVGTSMNFAKEATLSIDIVRRMAADLVQTGVAPIKADAAAMKLVHYCNTKTLAPKEVLVGELAKIDTNLTERSLALLQEYSAGASIAKSSTKEKKTNVAKATDLLRCFQQNLTQATTALGLAAFLTMGCGLKTYPKSDVIDYRPDIPFRNTIGPAAVHPQNPSMPSPSGEIEAQEKKK